MRVVAFLESENNIEGFAENGGVEGCVLITIISSQSLAAEKKSRKMMGCLLLLTRSPSRKVVFLEVPFAKYCPTFSNNTSPSHPPSTLTGSSLDVNKNVMKVQNPWMGGMSLAARRTIASL